MRSSSLLILLLALSVPIAYGEEITIPISFQEISGISGGGWSTDITNNVTTVQLTGILNHNTFDVTNLEAQLEMSNEGTIFCTVLTTISSLSAGQTDNFVWTCPIEGTADSASGVILGYDLDPIEQEVTTTNSTATVESTVEVSTVTTESTSTSTEDEPTNEITTNFVLGEHDMNIIMEDYQGTSKFVTFTGSNFTTSDTLDIEVIDSNNSLIVDIQTMVNGGGDFSVPAIVDTSTLSIENYDVTIKGANVDLAFIISWTGTVFSFEGEITADTSSETTSETTTESTSTISSDITSTSTTSSSVTDWNQFILDQTVEDRLGLVKAVFAYILG